MSSMLEHNLHSRFKQVPIIYTLLGPFLSNHCYLNEWKALFKRTTLCGNSMSLTANYSFGLNQADHLQDRRPLKRLSILQRFQTSAKARISKRSLMIQPFLLHIVTEPSSPASLRRARPVQAEGPRKPE